ncbi:hypothetical protein M9Y10_039800 [Tritrichomonas musculus]|uniref:Alpha-N-acetylglucosaminidase n=1 Tax=Tritrichomonas musculus TaxID=1915356 RepID=A0ABR2GQI3_9EUKA
MIFLLLSLVKSFYDDPELQAAYEVILRQVPECGIESGKVQLSKINSTKNGNPVYEHYSTKGILYVSGNTGFAICHGFYQFMKTQEYGIITWSGKQIQWPSTIPDTSLIRQESPVRYHYNFNVVTFGYTMPYFDWERWQKEIDWMALHGIDLPLSYSGFEAIGTRVWRQFNLTQTEIDTFYVGPSFLPWQRMGNIINHDSTVTNEYHSYQISLQHKILNALQNLGMTPICPAFAGFIPRGILRLYPNIKHYNLTWSNLPEKNQATLLSPEEDLFIKIGEMFIKEYEKEFGIQKFYISDTFNEMSIPSTDDRYAWLATMGERLYKSISMANKDAVWVIQGWLFSYQREEWDKEITFSFFSRVPNDKMLILDLATDYNSCIYHNEFNWDYYEGFYGKKWIYSVIPNMGGKSIFTGVLDYYRTGHLRALNDPNKGNLIGIGMAPEGFENNEMLYELYTDVFWSSDEKNMSDFLHNYAMNRYNKIFPIDIKKSWNLLKNSVYNELIDHPRFNWQLKPGTKKGTACISNEFESGLRLWVLASVTSNELENCELYKVDVIEASCQLAGIKLEEICKEIIESFENGNKNKASQCFYYFDSLIHMIDNVLEFHPHFRLAEWMKYAEKMAGGNEELKTHYIENSRYIITLWADEPGNQLSDYAAKMWSGLLRDYYFNRWRIWFNGKLIDKDDSEINKEVHEFESGFRFDNNITRVPLLKDVFKACRDLVTFSDSINLSNWEWPN